MRVLGKGWLVAGLMIFEAVGKAHASGGDPTLLHRDTALEQNLRQQASPDQIVTPGRVLRAIFHSQARASQTNSLFDRAEFQPIVGVKNSRVKLVAAWAVSF